jgi:serine/threonine-protein kinase RsbW
MDNNNQIKSIILTNRIEELDRIQLYLEELTEKWGLSFAICNTFNLVLEEAFTNLVNYAYVDQEPHTIKIVFERKSDRVVITLVDDGQFYDPTVTEDPDISLSAEERPIGGLGIYLIKKLMDVVEYKRIEDKNYLIITKLIPV